MNIRKYISTSLAGTVLALLLLPSLIPTASAAPSATGNGSYVTAASIKVGSDVYVDGGIGDNTHTFYLNNDSSKPKLPDCKSSYIGFSKDGGSYPNKGILYVSGVTGSGGSQGCSYTATETLTLDSTNVSYTYIWLSATTIKKADGTGATYTQQSGTTFAAGKNGSCTNTIVVGSTDSTKPTTGELEDGKEVSLGHGGTHCQYNGQDIKIAALSADNGAGPGSGSTGCTTGTDANGNCEASNDATLDCGSSALNWIVCPVITLAQGAAEKLDSFITSTLDVDVGPIFDNTTVSGSSANGYYTAWNSFRIIATALLIIGGLVMVASQALGFEFLDAYTVRKVLPRLLIAIIGMSLSWPLMRLVISFFDTLGFDIRSLMYSPFKNVGGGVALGTGALVTLFAPTVALFALGPAALTFILTALLAVFVGFIILVIRQVALIMLIILAPVAIACYILPNTQKVWKLWYDNFLGLLLMFPIISALIAAGHIFAAVSLKGIPDMTAPSAAVAQGLALIAYFVPYFLLPLAARLATGVIGNLAGVVNDRHKGAFDRLKGVRANSMTKRHQARMAGQTKFGSTAAGSIYRRGASIGDPNSGAANVFSSSGRAKFREYERGHLAHVADEALKNDNGRWAGDDDANALAATGIGGNEFLTKMIEKAKSQGMDDPTARQRALSALGGLESSYGAKMGSEAMQVTAYKAWAGSSTGAATGVKGWEERREIGAEMVRDGLMTSTDVAGAIKGNAKRADGSSASYGKMIQFFEAAAKGGYAVDNDGVKMDERYMLRNAMHGAGPGEALGGHTNTVTSFADPTYEDFIGAASNPDEQIKLAAEISGRYSALNQVSKEKADVWAEKVMAKESGHIGKDKDGNDVMLNVQQYITTLRSDPVFQTRSRELEQQAVVGIGAFQAQQAALQQQQLLQQQILQGGPPGGNIGGNLGGRLSDRRLKRDVAGLGITSSGIQLYRFKYLWSNQEYVGVMAQDLVETHPEALSTDELGYYRVDYAKLGLQMLTIEEWETEQAHATIKG